MKEMYFKKDLTKIKLFKENVRAYAQSKEVQMQEREGETQIHDDIVRAFGHSKEEKSEYNGVDWLCQMKKDSKWTLGVGSKALTITIEDFSEDTIKVKIGEGKWLSKVTGGIVTSLASGPLFLVAAPATALGIYGQTKLNSEIVLLANLALK